MNVDDFALVPDLDSQLVLKSSPALSGLLPHSDERSLYKQNDMNPHMYTQYNQSPYMAQEGECPQFTGSNAILC